MKIDTSLVLGALISLSLSALASAQSPAAPVSSGQNAKVLRGSCVASERVSIATDANDFSHLKDTDWMEARYCQGFIQGFEIGANHTVYVLSEPKRLEIFSSQHSIRQIAKGVVVFIDEHPDEDDPRNIVLGALQKDGAAVLFGGIKIQDLTPECPKDLKEMPPGGCNLMIHAK